MNETPLYIDTQQASDDVDQFFRLYLDTYYGTVKQLFEKYDPNHLLLGDRWLTLPMQSTKLRGILAEEAGKHMDVISINHYSPNLDTAMLKDVYEKSGHRPILLSEWSYGTGEQGLAPIVPGSAATEQERGWRYRNYVESAASLGFSSARTGSIMSTRRQGDDTSRASAASITTRGSSTWPTGRTRRFSTR